MFKKIFFGLLTLGSVLIYSEQFSLAVGEAELIAAVRVGNVADILYYIAQGANVNYSDGTYTVLHRAIEGGSLPAVDALLNAGADVNPPQASYAPLHFAVMYRQGSDDIFNRLLEAGADVTRTDWSGRTALQLAGREGYRITAPLYHAVKRANLASILKDGLLASQGGTNPHGASHLEGLSDELMESFQRTSVGRVHATTSLATAKRYQDLLKKEGEDLPIILQFEGGSELWFRDLHEATFDQIVHTSSDISPERLRIGTFSGEGELIFRFPEGSDYSEL